MDKDQEILAVTKHGDLTQINFGEMKDQITDQVRAFLLNMMPKEAIGGVCEIAWKHLTSPRPEIKDRYNNVKTPARPSELEEMVISIMRTKMKEKVAAWGELWTMSKGANKEMDACIEKLVTRAGKAHMRKIGREIVEAAMQAVVGMSTCCGVVIAANTTCPRCQKFIQ